MTLAGRLALVTGGSRGIGRAISVDLARRGVDVAFSYLRNHDAADETERLINATGRRGVAIRGRVDTADACQRLVDAAGDALGGLDVLVSNAATGVNRPAVDVRERHWDWTMNTNARALVFLAQAATPLMTARGGGAIVALSSLGAHRVLPNYMLVGVSKAALECAVRYLAVELAPSAIRVNAVSGGVVRTGALDHFPNRDAMIELGTSRVPAGRILEPQDLASAVAWLVSDESRMVIGQTIIVDGGFSLPA